jgi:hypothetical protein
VQDATAEGEGETAKQSRDWPGPCAGATACMGAATLENTSFQNADVTGPWMDPAGRSRMPEPGQCRTPLPRKKVRSRSDRATGLDHYRLRRIAAKNRSENAKLGAVD